MMRISQLNRSFLFRSVLIKQWDHYTDAETNILIGICNMNDKGNRCSCNTLFKYMSKIHRTPYKKKLLLTIRKFKQEGMIIIFGKGCGTNMRLTTAAQLHLFELEKKLRRIR